MSGKKMVPPYRIPSDLQDRIDTVQRNRERTLIRLMTSISRACITAGTRSAGKFNISMSQALVMVELFSHNGCCQEGLRMFVALDKGNVTRALQRLEALGLVERKQDSGDRRLVRVYVTRQALALESRMSAIAAGLDDRLVRGFTASERDKVVDFLQRMEANARAMVMDDTTGGGGV